MAPYAHDPTTPLYLYFLLELNKILAGNDELEADDVKQLVTALNLIVNNKIKASKTTAGKKGKKKGPVLQVSKGSAGVFDEGAKDNAYDSYGDDFM